MEKIKTNIVDDSGVKDDGNTAKSDGINLDLSSSEHKNYEMDKLGIDEHRQDEIKRKVLKPKVEGEAILIDEDNRARREQLAKSHSDLRNKNVSSRETIQQKKQKRELYKFAVADEIENDLRHKVAATPDKSDDVDFNKRAKRLIDTEIHDSSKTSEDFFPGSKLLNKY